MKLCTRILALALVSLSAIAGVKAQVSTVLDGAYVK